MEKKRIIVGISGASGVIYGVELIKHLKRLHIEVHLILTSAGEKVLSLEMSMEGRELKEYVDVLYGASEIGAPPASGSYPHHGMVICPCTMASLGCIANGIGDDLLTRAADVTLKEGKKLILVTRETPLNLIHLENMVKAARAGATIMPASPGFYHHPSTIGDLVHHLVGRVMDQLGIKHHLISPWEGENALLKGARYLKK